MVAEMTGNLSMLAPAMIAIGIATVVVGDRTIYRSQLAHSRRVAGAPVPVRPAVDGIHHGRGRRTRARLVLSTKRHRRARAAARLEAADLPGAPVVDGRRASRAAPIVLDLARFEPAARLGEIELDGLAVTVDDGLDDALALLADAHRSWAPVTSMPTWSVSCPSATFSPPTVRARGERASSPFGRPVRGTGRGRSAGGVGAGRADRRLRLAGRATRCLCRSRAAIGSSSRAATSCLEAGDQMTIFATPSARGSLERLLAGPLEDATESADVPDG